jgi:uncharacterized membrane protein
MQINNPLRMNDWNIKSFLWLVFSIQIFLLVLIGLDLVNIQIPILRQFISFIFLTFIPGILILRILKIHDRGNAETVLYSVGLSIGSLMLIGLFMNTVYPFFGISKPISLFNLIITINFFVLLLCIFSYLRDKNFLKPSFIQVEGMLSPSVLFLCLLPFFSIFGTYLLNGYGNNTLQMALLVIIAILPLITLKWIPKRFYSLVIFVVSLSLLFHTSLVSWYVWGADLSSELITANYVLKNALWYPSIEGDYNAMLSVVLLSPIYSILSNLSLIWCFKIIYPVIFSLVPVGLFVVYNKLTNNKIAFLACIFFISVNAFFTTLPATARQEVGELFLVLILMMVVDEKISADSKSILLVLFGFSLVFSHYGLSFILLLIIGVSILFILILNRFPTKWGIKDIRFENFKIINYSFPLFILCVVLAWYIYVSNASIFHNVTLIGYSIINSITNILNPQTSQGLFYLKGSLPYFQSIERYLYVICEVFIAIGIFNLLFNNKINPEFKALSIASFFILVMGLIFPYFSGALNTDRLFHINLFFLAIFFVTGFLTVIKGFNHILNKYKLRSIEISSKNSLYTIGIFLLIFSIFNTAFIYQVFDQPKNGRFALDNNQDFFWANNQEISGIEWLKNTYDPQTKIFADVYKSITIESLIYLNKTPPNFVFLSSTGGYSIEYQTDPSQEQNFYSNILLNDSYVFLGTFNIKNKVLIVHGENQTHYIRDPDLENKILKLYDNGGSWILKGTGS